MGTIIFKRSCKLEDNQLYLEELQHFHPLVGKRRSLQHCGLRGQSAPPSLADGGQAAMASATDEVAMIRGLIVAADGRGRGCRQRRFGVASPAALLDLPGRMDG